MSRSDGQYEAPIRCASGVWYSEAARALVAGRLEKDPVEAIRASVGKLLREAEIAAPPVDLGIVGSFVAVMGVDNVPISDSGRLLSLRNGFRIQLSTNQTHGRRRFTHAHELGHILIPNTNAGQKRRHDASTGEYARSQEEEYLCDAAASELLMPAPMFRSVLADGGPDLTTLRRAASAFDVSLEAAGIRITQCDLWDCAVIVWEEALKRSQIAEQASNTPFPGMEEFEPRPRLRVRYAVCSPAMRSHHFPKEKSAEEGSAIGTCLRSSQIVRGQCHLPTAKGPLVFSTESVLVPYGAAGSRRNRVITMATPPD